jgi:hypothetical protein
MALPVRCLPYPDSVEAQEFERHQEFLGESAVLARVGEEDLEPAESASRPGGLGLKRLSGFPRQTWCSVAVD